MQFNEWDKWISRFIWAGKRPRIQFKTLQLAKEKGGRSLPCLSDYYKAAQLRPLACCCNPNYTAKWKDLEISQLDIPLQSILGSKTLYELHSDGLNQWSKTCLRIWFKECKSLPALERQSRLLRWVAFDPEFKPSRIDERFKHWFSRGITAYCLITSNGGLDSFQKISDKYGLEKIDFFRYLQTWSYFNVCIKPSKECETNLADVFINMYNNKDNRKLVSKLYSCIQINKKYSTDKIRLKWDKESQSVITEEQWLNICSVQLTSTSSGLWRDFCWRNLTRYFITPKLKFAQTGDLVRGLCWRNCGEQLADHYHILWSCPAIQPYWQVIIRVIQTIIGNAINSSFSTIYLGNISPHFPGRDKYLLKILLAASKKAITRRWLQPTPPAESDWTDIVSNIQNMERMTFSLNLQIDKYLHYWEKWIVYVR